MRLRMLFGAIGLAVLCAALVALPAFAVHGGDIRVSEGSPTGPFSQNKQNEPAVAIDANHPDVVVAGANDNIDMEACNAGDDSTCPFTAGVGVSGVYFSFDSGDNWSQPTYTGLTARNCLGVPGGSDDPPSADFCEPEVGPIGTLPNYYENGLVSDGDPAVAFGPTPDAQGNFSWSNGSRLYYANLTSNLPGETAFKGFEAIAVSHIDGPASTGLTPAIVENQENWSDPVIASRQNSALFSDKEQIWADNAESSPYFGNAYVCFAAFQGNGAQPLKVLTSEDGGSSWTSRQVTSAANNPNSQQGFGRSGCTVRTDSDGVVYVFVNQFGFDPKIAAAGKIQMIKSFDGGKSWTRPRNIFTAFDTCNYFEPSIGRCVEDGVAGARSDLSSAPSVDIANGAPTGDDATDELVLTWVDGRDGLNKEHVLFTSSGDGGNNWATPDKVEQPGDRGYYSAPAISPNGTDTWLVYNAFTTLFRDSAEGSTNDRQLVGVVLHADVSDGAVGTFSEIHRGASGDARGSSQNDLAAEFLGDYVYAAATRTYGAAVWNDVRNAANCPAIDEYRQELHEEAVATGTQTAEAEEPRGEELRMQRGPKQQEEEAAAPPVQQVCPANFGNSDIFGGSYANPPTP